MSEYTEGQQRLIKHLQNRGDFTINFITMYFSESLEIIGELDRKIEELEKKNAALDKELSDIYKARVYEYSDEQERQGKLRRE